jgi:hypothetical protein
MDDHHIGVDLIPAVISDGVPIGQYRRSIVLSSDRRRATAFPHLPSVERIVAQTAKYLDLP